MPPVVPLEDRVRAVMARHLRLKVPPETVAVDEPLFGGRLGLDSIDALELAVGLEREFKVHFPDPETGAKILKDISTICAFLRAQGAAE